MSLTAGALPADLIVVVATYLVTVAPAGATHSHVLNGVIINGRSHSRVAAEDHQLSH